MHATHHEGSEERPRLLPDLPPALEEFVRRHHPQPELARRALVAPQPGLGFRSAYQDRRLWAAGAHPPASLQRRALYEEILAFPQDYTQDIAHPFFAEPGTGGMLRSPFPELTDAEYWLFAELWGSEEIARRKLDGSDGLAAIRTARQGGLLRRLYTRFLYNGDPIREVYALHEKEVHGVYL